MNWKYALTAIVLSVGFGAVLGCSGRGSRLSGAKDGSTDYDKEVGGFKVRLVAVEDSGSVGGERAADHSWTPDGFPYEGPEARLALRTKTNTSGGGSPRCLVFELEQPIGAPKRAKGTTNIDVFGYLPKNGFVNDDTDHDPGSVGPLTIQLRNGMPRDFAGNLPLAEPSSVAMGYGVQSTDRQPVVFGIAQGEFRVLAKGAASVVGLTENQTATLASGPWGRIEATCLPRPQMESAPSPTHRFRLLGGAFPPRNERKVFFYDRKGRQIGSCGDGPNNPGYAGPFFFAHSLPADIARFEVQERPYEFVQFDGVSFDAPQVRAYSGQEGFDHVQDSAIGQIVGVLKSTKYGPWSGSVLYSSDGIRWVDPGPELAAFEYGQFDASNEPLGGRLNILIEPDQDLLAANAPTQCEVYAVDSPEGQRKEQLTGRNEMTLRAPMTSISCKATTRPYVRIEMRVGDGHWRTLDTIPVSEQMLGATKPASIGSMVLQVFFDDSGAIRIGKVGEGLVRSRARWRQGEDRVRVIARLRDGKAAEVDFNVSGYSGLPPNEKRYRGMVYAKHADGTHLQSGFKRIDLKDISSFEVQAQGFKPPLLIPVHSPVD
jgi:hypothetical protein